MSQITVLALLGSSGGALHRQLTQPTPAGVTVTVAAGLTDLPRYRDNIGLTDIPSAVTALRAAAAEADAALVVTPSRRGTIPPVLKNAIDWLSHPAELNALSDKPLAVIGAAAGRYGGVWAHHQPGDADGSPDAAGQRVIETITVASLSDMVSKLAVEASHSRQDGHVATG
jgi:NAD(P)H-dependent FMN reductase